MSTFQIDRSDWIVDHPDTPAIDNFVVQRKGGQHFHVTMVDDSITIPQPDGTVKVANFRQALLFEHDQGHDKVGDVVIQFRQHPQTNRYMVQVDQENVFVTETTVQIVWRAIRSSVDNIGKAVKKPVNHCGWLYANPRRIGGKPIKVHYVIAGWSVQVADQMMDVFDYVQTLDSLGLATLLKALQHMPDQPARIIFEQIRTAPASSNNNK